ncbi:glycosyltransferase family 2 protein [Butyrivibrio sp. AE2032]|uniref:glycosyltransferase family 2 protein n=1 Tax=Butyrivibrio sp. AE2032 TaxID=1458463 RepID=UPI000690146C|nr:glycosyltransferase [Butyrivibrio sp. AE2032]
MSLISVIIPVYNTAEYLDECMTSVLDQNFKDLEIMLVDDGSTDGISPRKCDDYAARDCRVKVIHKENGGLMSAWIEGVVEATSDYVSFVDSDDWIDLDMMEKLYKRTNSSFVRYEIIAGNYIVEKAGERRKETQGLKPGEYTGKALQDLRGNLLGNEVRPVTMSRCMKLISRQLVLENIKYCDPSITMGEDVNITLPCLCDCRRLVILEEAYFYHYRLVTGSMAHAYNPKLLPNLELTDKTFREILKEKKVLNANHQMDREFVIMLMVIMKNALRCQDQDTISLIKDIFLRPDIRSKIKDTKVTISGKANKLMYFTAKHPNGCTISFAKAVITAFDKKTN